MVKVRFALMSAVHSFGKTKRLAQYPRKEDPTSRIRGVQYSRTNHNRRMQAPAQPRIVARPTFAVLAPADLARPAHVVRAEREIWGEWDEYRYIGKSGHLRLTFVVTAE